MNDAYRKLLRDYLTALNNPNKYPYCFTKKLEMKLWEVVLDERSSEPSESLHSGGN